MEEAKKVKVNMQEREIGFELVSDKIESYISKKWGMLGFGVPTATTTYVTLRVLSELVYPKWQKTATEQDFPTFVYFNVKEKDLQEKINFIMEDLFSQKVSQIRGYSRAGRPSLLAPLRRLARRDWLFFNDFCENYKQDYLTKEIKEENLLFTDENIKHKANNKKFPFGVDRTKMASGRRKRQGRAPPPSRALPRSCYTS